MTKRKRSGKISNVAAETQKQRSLRDTGSQGIIQTIRGRNQKDEKKYLTNRKDFDRISELLRKRQSNTVWYDLRSSKELRKKFKKVLDKHKEMC